MDDIRPITVGEFAQIVGLTVRRIQQLSAEGLIPKTDKGKYDIAAAFPAYINHVKAQNSNSAETGYERHRARKMRAMAESAEIDLRKKKGELVEIEAIASQVKDEYVYVRQKLLGIPSKAALQLSSITDPVQIQAKLSDLINDALSDLKADQSYVTSGNSSERKPSEETSGSQASDTEASAETSP